MSDELPSVRFSVFFWSRPCQYLTIILECNLMITLTVPNIWHNLMVLFRGELFILWAQFDIRILISCKFSNMRVDNNLIIRIVIPKGHLCCSGQLFFVAKPFTVTPLRLLTSFFRPNTFLIVTWLLIRSIIIFIWLPHTYRRIVIG